MREVPEPPLSPWHPPAYRVDEEGKVEGAHPGEPHNWGRWGEHDQRGTLNLLTPERVAEAAQLVRTGKRFSLGLPIGGLETPTHRARPLHLFSHTTGDTVLGDWGPVHLQTSDDYVVMALQASTQIDGFGHFTAGDALYNGYWAGLVAARSGARRLGIHHLAEGFVGRAVLLDVARHLGREPLEAGFAIGPELLDEVAATQGVEVRAGDAVLVRTGWLGWWLAQAEKPALSREPGISPRALPWLHRHDVALLATDTTAVEVLPPEEGQVPLGVHVGALRDLGMPLGELFDLDELAADCAADRVYECFFVASILPVVGAVGSPVNPIAIK